MPGSIVGGVMANEAGKKAAKAAKEAAAVDYITGLEARENIAPWMNLGSAAANELAMLQGLGPLPQQQRVSSSIRNQKSPWDRPPGAFDSPDPWLGWDYGSGNVQYDSWGNMIGGAGSYGTGGGGYGYSGDDPRASAQQAAMGRFTASPDYQFRLSEGLKALDRSAASRGMLLSGAQTKAAQRYGGDLASGEYNTYVNRLMSMAGLGQTATQGANNAMVATNTAAGNQIANAGQARASGYAAMGQGFGQGINNVLSAAAYGFGGGFG